MFNFNKSIMIYHIELKSKMNSNVIKSEWLDDIIVYHSEFVEMVKLTEAFNSPSIISSIKFHFERMEDLINEIYDKDWQSLTFKNFDKKRNELDNIIEQLTFDLKLLNIENFHQITFSLKFPDKISKRKIYEITKKLFKNIISICEFRIVGKNQSQVKSIVDFVIDCRINRLNKTNSFRKKHHGEKQ